MTLFTRSVLIVAAVGLALGSAGCTKAAKQKRHLAAANRYFNSGDYQKAEIEYRNVLQLDPGHFNGDAIARLGVIYFDQGRISRIYAFLAKARELQPNNLEVRRKLAAFYATIGKSDEARAEAFFILEHYPQDEEAPVLLAELVRQPKEVEEIRSRLQALPAAARDAVPAQVALGMLYLRQGKLKEAQFILERARAQKPNSSAVNMAFASLLMAQNNLVEADKSFAAAAAQAPARSPIAIRYAQFKLRMGQADAAKKLAQKMTQATPDFLPGWLLLATIEAGEKNYDECLVAVGRAIAIDPQHPEALMLSARAKFAKGDIEKAITELERALAVYPKSAELHHQLGIAYAAKGDLAKAVASFTQAATLAPGVPNITLALAELNLRQGNGVAAITALKTLVKQHPEIVGARLLLAQAYRVQRNLDEALAVYRQLAVAFPTNPQAPYFAGLVLLEQRKLVEARKAFNDALALDSSYPPAIEELVNISIAEKQFDAARQLVEAQMKKSPKATELHLLLAKTYLAEKKTNEAEAALQKFISLSPDSPTGYQLLAQLYLATNQREKAVEKLQIALSRNPKNAEALLLLGVIFEQQKNYAGARENYEKVIAINPRSGVALNNLAYLYSEQFGELEKAFEMAQRGRALSPHVPYVADTLGWILYKKRQYSWALTLLSEGSEKLPGSAEVNYHVGMTHYMMGEERSARAALERALALDADFFGNKDARQALKILAIDPASAGNAERAQLEQAAAERADPIAQLRLEAIYERAGQLDKAVAACEAALAVSSNNVAAATTLVRLHMLRNETAKALELGKATRKIAPDDPNLGYLLGKLAYATRDYGWSFSLLQESARRLGDNPELLYDLAQAAYPNGQISVAETALHDALQQNPAFVRADKAKAFQEMLALAGDPKKAAAATSVIEGALKSDPTNVPALIAQAGVYELQGNLSGARQNYKKSLELFPDFSPARRSLTLLNAKAKSADGDAVEMALRARNAYPNDIELAKASGIILYRAENYARALPLLQETCRAQPSDSEAFYYLGMTQHQMKDRPASVRSLQRALEIGLKADLAVEAKKILAPPS